MEASFPARNFDEPLPNTIDRVRAKTPARILAGRAGASYRTETLLRLRADHAAARDAVTARARPGARPRKGFRGSLGAV